MSTPSPLESPLREALAPTYQLIRRLGQGGMGTVFLARDPALKRDVAVKVLSPELSQDPGAHARFEREAQAVAALAHPNVVAIFGVGQMKDLTPYFVMQYVAGRSLADRIEQEGPVSVPEARAILGEVAAALAAAHAKGIIHRDIKPANVLQDEVSGRVLVSDFGLAALGRVAATDTHTPVDPDSFAGSDMRLTQSGMRVGTPQYMSPEQLVAEEVTERTDIYALGLLAYELLLGQGPFPGKTAGELIAAHLRDTPAPLASRRDDVDAELDALVSLCLAKDASRRPTAEDLAQRLSPRGTALLEWPPPGLEWARGALWKHAFGASIFSGSLATAYAVLVLLGDGMADVSGSGAGVVVSAALVVGTLGLAARARLLLQDGWRAARTVRAGYTWWTVLEAGADANGDTGALISGVQRFAPLSDAQRSSLRRLRVRVGVLAIAAAFGGPLLLLALTMLGGRGAVGATLAACIAAFPLLVQGVVGFAPRARERALLGPRVPMKTAAARAAQLDGVASTWYGAFDAVRGAGSVGRGRSGRPLAGLLVGAVLLLTALACGVLLGPLSLVSARGPGLASVLASRASVPASTERLDRERPWMALAPPVDSSISPLRAGAALYALHTMLLPNEVMEHPAERPRAAYAPLPTLEGNAAVFVDVRPSNTGLRNPAQIVARAARGFTSAELAWLRSLEAHPVWVEFGVIARAAAVDEIEGRYRLPLDAEVQLYSMPAYRFVTLPELAVANAWRAALRLAEGDRVGAERVLREGFGVARARSMSPLGPEISLGLPIAGLTRVALEELYRVTGDARGAALRVEVDSLAAVGLGLSASEQNRRIVDVGYREARLAQLRAIRDRSAPISAQFDAVASVAMLQCTSLREVLFGPAPDLIAAIAYARDSVARYPSERDLVERMLFAPEQAATQDWTPNVTAHQVAGRMLKFSGRVLGNRRMQGCAHFLVES